MVSAFLICMACSSVGIRTSINWTLVCICSQNCLLGFFSRVLNSPVGWQDFQNVCRYCLGILKDVLRGYVEGMNGMIGICVSLALHCLLPLRNWERTFIPNEMRKHRMLREAGKRESRVLFWKSLLPDLLVFTYPNQTSVCLWRLFFPANSKKRKEQQTSYWGTWAWLWTSEKVQGKRHLICFAYIKIK